MKVKEFYAACKVGLVLFIGYLIVASVMPKPTKAMPSKKTMYIWAHVLDATTTAVDCTFTTSWNQISVVADSARILMKVGANDTNNWASRPWIFVAPNTTIEFGPATKVKKITYKTETGTGKVAFLGLKTVPPTF